jgi:LysR family transcriptional regulator, glycine cleavage system transcriptional activator
MPKPMPPLNALRAFEAAARHLSLTRAAVELHVTPGALSHQIRGLEELLGRKLFERRARAIALTPAGKLLYPGLQTGFAQISEAVEGLGPQRVERVLVISAPPGFTAKWLVPRLYRFTGANPEIDVRVSSSVAYADFAADGVDVAVRNLPVDARADSTLVIEKLIELSVVPVCAPRLVAAHGPFARPEALRRVPLIHDETLVHLPAYPTWPVWFKAVGVAGADVSRGLRFNSTDHALDAASEGVGVLLAHDLPAYDDLRTGRLVVPVGPALSTGRAYYFACPKSRGERPHVRAFRAWVKQEIAAVDWATVPGLRERTPRSAAVARRKTKSAGS